MIGNELDPGRIRERFDATTFGTVGLEEELLLLDPLVHLPVGSVEEVVAAAADPRIKRELPSCQVEIATRPHLSVDGAVAELVECRRHLEAVASGLDLRVAAAAVHPLVPRMSPSDDPRHREIDHHYREVARRQLVASLQVHVAVGSAELALRTYNSLRSHLPEIAALAAAAPFHDGHDTGLASIRPVVSGQLPRQGVPPVIESWEAFAADLAWGRAGGSVPEPRWWWWELRPHVLHGTLEVHVADVQATPTDARSIAETVVALVRYVATALESGVALPVDPTWRIAENRWCALRDGVHGTLADLSSGEPVPTSRRLHQLLDTVEPFAAAGLDGARAMVTRNGADVLREIGPTDACAWLADVFSPRGAPVTAEGGVT